MGKPLEDIRMIIAHLGNGASITAVKNGKSVDTGMGFTPIEGLVMGTRCGDTDPGVYSYPTFHAGMDVAQVDEMLNKNQVSPVFPNFPTTAAPSKSPPTKAAKARASPSKS
ncbi:acetate kinase [Neisseria gonorrhoeae]|uniref:Acetate kinase n=1 Tax=Neisseria gonorrhoeae TaxID=485 RepID=A0A378VT12_NEIGO|nr:acetate kinase [Neisseria gonorrhoeae]